MEISDICPCTIDCPKRTAYCKLDCKKHKVYEAIKRKEYKNRYEIQHARSNVIELEMRRPRRIKHD